VSGGKGISFGQDNRGQQTGWIAFAVAEHEIRARDSRFTVIYRIEQAALAFANKIGHAEFDDDELALILGRELDLGGRKLAGESTVRKAVKDGIRLGVLLEGSNRRCLIVPQWAAQTEWSQRDSLCHEHRIGLRKHRRSA